MRPPNPRGDPEAPPVAAPPPVAFPPKVSPPPTDISVSSPPHVGPPPTDISVSSPPHVDVGTPIPGTQVGVWNTGLCSCFNDPSNCWITLFCPCITFGQNVEIIEEGSTSCVSASKRCILFFCSFYSSFWYTCTYRTKLRGRYSIPGDQCRDCCVHLWCEPCALCQEYRELKNRGFDPPIGWVANKDRQVGITVPPSVPGMIR